MKKNRIKKHENDYIHLSKEGLFFWGIFAVLAVLSYLQFQITYIVINKPAGFSAMLLSIVELAFFVVWVFLVFMYNIGLSGDKN